MKIDFSACANFKGNNQKPLWLAEARGLLRPKLKKIADNALEKGLDAVVLRSYSHPEGTDRRWSTYSREVLESEEFSYTSNGVIKYQPKGSQALFLIHGQGLMTSAGDIQILFTSQEIGGRGSSFISDFNYLTKVARDSGENVMIIASKPYNWKLDNLEKVDAIETHNGLDTHEHNIASRNIAINHTIPGVVVSNSKILTDLGTSYTTLSMQVNECNIAEQIKQFTKSPTPNGKRSISQLSRLVQTLAIIEVNITGNKD
jgi:hypothetical protein